MQGSKISNHAEPPFRLHMGAASCRWVSDPEDLGKIMMNTVEPGCTCSILTGYALKPVLHHPDIKNSTQKCKNHQQVEKDELILDRQAQRSGEASRTKEVHLYLQAIRSHGFLSHF